MGRKKPLIRVQSVFSAIKDNPQAYRDFWSPIADQINFIADEARAEKNKKFKQDPNYVCSSAWQRMTIAHDGTVAQCYTDYHLKNPLGNVNEKSLYEIWHDEPFKRLRYLQKTKQRLKLPPCKECCSGGVTEEKVITINDKKIKILEYVGQELDIEKIDARKHGKNKDRK
jgi:radical SAM protein with 4Fe4S-binding SPASM domain